MHVISAVSHQLKSELCIFFGPLPCCSPCFLLQVQSMSLICLIRVPGLLRWAADELPNSPHISFTSILCSPAVISNWAHFNSLQSCMGNQCPWTTSSIIHDLGRGKWLQCFLLFLLMKLSFYAQKEELELWCIYNIS